MKYNPHEKDNSEQKLHIVAHLDFLGASEKMKSTKDRNDFLQKLRIIYNDVIDVMTEKELSGEESVKIRIFSDNIVIAKETSDHFDRNAIFEVFSYSCFFQAYALLHGLLVRGGISLGDFYMDNTFVFGEALVKAYKKESEQAVYPRIIVDKSMLRGVAVRALIDGWNTFDNMLEQDFDGELFLNFINPLLHPEDKKSSIEYLIKAQKSIIALCAKDWSNDKVRQKLFWLFNKYNELCEKYGYSEQKISHNEDYEPDIFHPNHLSEEYIYSILSEVFDPSELGEETMEVSHE